MCGAPAPRAALFLGVPLLLTHSLRALRKLLLWSPNILLIELYKSQKGQGAGLGVLGARG